MKISAILFSFAFADLIGWNRLGNRLLANQDGIRRRNQIRGSVVDYLSQIFDQYPEYMRYEMVRWYGRENNSEIEMHGF